MEGLLSDFLATELAKLLGSQVKTHVERLYPRLFLL